MGSTIDTKSSTIVGGSTPELLSLSPNGLHLVLPTARGRKFPTMGGRRTHILDGAWKGSYSESLFFKSVGRLPKQRLLFHLAKGCPNLRQSGFTGGKFMRPGRSGGDYFNRIAR